MKPLPYPRTNPYQWQGRQASGFSLIELMIATIIIFIVVTGSIELTLRAINLFKQSAAREALEALVSEDIGWLRAYSKSWHCQVGPYEGCKTKTKGLASAINYRPEIYSPDSTSEYQAFRSLCQNRSDSTSTETPAHQMLYDAAEIASDDPYSPPNTILQLSLGEEIALNTVSTPLIAKSYRIYRTLDVDTGGNSVTVRYHTKTSDKPYVSINKSSKLFIEATAWCP